MDTKLAEIRNRLNTDKEYYNEQFQLLFVALKANIQKNDIQVNREAFDELRKTDAFKSILLDFIIMPYTSQSRIDQILDHIRIAPTPIPSISETPILSEEIATHEPVIEDLNSKILMFLKNHKHGEYVSSYLQKEFNTDYIHVKNALKELVTQHLVIYTEKDSQYNKKAKYYRYCPEAYELVNPKRKRIDVVCSAIKNILLDAPGMTALKLRSEVKAYLGINANGIIADALYIMQETNFLTWTQGPRNAKYFTVNENYDENEAAKIRRDFLQSKRGEKYNV